MRNIIFLLVLLLVLFIISHYASSRRILHQPFFPVTDKPPPPPPTTTQPPSLPPSPQPLPKHPFSSLTPPTTTHHHHHHHTQTFFPTTTTPPTIPTFPANITSIILPSSSSSSKSHTNKKILFLSLTLSLISILFISTLVTTLLYRRTHPPSSSDSLRLFPANLPTSDKPPPLPTTFSTPSTEFLYLGTLINPLQTTTTIASPELHPLPPLPRQDYHYHNNVEESDDMFFSPKGSSSPVVVFETQKMATVPTPPPVPELLRTQRKEEIVKPKLKGLHWDKVNVKSRSEKAMVWDHLKFSNSFKLNEEMIETLFMAKSSSTVAPNHSTNEPTVRPVTAEMARVLDPHKSRNIAILLRAFNLTIDEVCDCILQGNVDSLGPELLGSLLKMAPTREEEVRLKEMNDALFDPAEKFLKAIIHIPFAFKRVDAMLYISNFEAEVEYLKGSFDTIKSACQQLRDSRMFIKLLEAVLMAGNRLNTGTTRGDAHAFKLDTLVKLIDVKGIDGKTTLLHFVVQEIARTEYHVSRANQQSELCDEVESTKRGLEVVSSLSGELSSVKKAATMDLDILLKEVEKLAMGLTKIKEMVALNERFGSNKQFSDSMNVFLKQAGDDIVEIKTEEQVAVSMVKETTEYFHGSLTMEENQPLWIFMVVRDFLLVLDRVSKDVRKINERTIVGNRSRSLPSVFPRFKGPQDFGSSDGEDGLTA